MSDEVSRMKAVKDIGDYLGEIMRQHLDECTRCCVNCEHWVNGPLTAPIEVCGLADARPPAKVIAFGCERYLDKVPF